VNDSSLPQRVAALSEGVQAIGGLGLMLRRSHHASSPRCARQRKANCERAPIPTHVRKGLKVGREGLPDPVEPNICTVTITVGALIVPPQKMQPLSMGPQL
jgi:hypothetical protein